MVSIREFIKLLLLFPLILCDGGFKKLTDQENEQVQAQCGKFKKLDEGQSIMKYKGQEHLMSWISPNYFLIEPKILFNKFKEEDCVERRKQVTSYVKEDATTQYFAKFIGNCSRIPAGMVLVYNKGQTEEQKHWFCIHDKVTPFGEKVEILNGLDTGSFGDTVECDPPSKEFFCVESYNKVSGHVIIGKDQDWSIGGSVVDASNNKSIKVSNLASYQDQICGYTGICPGSVTIPKEPPTTTEATTKASTVAETSSKPLEKSTEPAKPSEEPSTVAVTQPTIPTTDKPIITQKGPETTTDEPTTKVSLASSDAPPATPPTVPSEPATSKKPNGPTPSLVSTKLPTGNSSDPQAEALKAQKLKEIDCEEENLCFDDDIFGSANALSALPFVCILVFTVFY